MRFSRKMDSEEQLVAIYCVMAIALCVGAFLIFG